VIIRSELDGEPTLQDAIPGSPIITIEGCNVTRFTKVFDKADKLLLFLV
jgi:uncharacterized metal-binding protein